MKKITIDSKTLYGIKVRTNNVDEQDTNTAKIGKLWMDFYPNVFMKEETPTIAFGVYTNYESDHRGDFDVVAAIENPKDTSNLTEIKTQGGTYLLVEKNGQMPQAVIEAWQDVWTYFADPSCKDVRSYLTDFETYVDDKSVKLYIGII